MIDAIILAGGFGTRLAQTVPSLPKALAPIQKTPFLKLLLEQLDASALFSRVVLALGHRAEAIESFCKTSSFSFQLIPSIEPSPLGTGGAILHALDKTENSTLSVLNGDSYSDLSFADLLQFHRDCASVGTIACREVDDVSRYGSISFDPSQKIVTFAEKSPLLEKRRGWISCGIYLFEKELFTSLPHRPFSLETDLFPLFLPQGLYAYPHRGTFIDIGTKESYEEAQTLLKPWIHQ